METQYDQVVFFTLALDLKDKYDLLKILTVTQIYRNFSVPLSLGQLNTTILAATTKVSAFMSLEIRLKEIQICFDLYSEVIDCPPRTDHLLFVRFIT